jgi:hypothetical protein
MAVGIVARGFASVEIDRYNRFVGPSRKLPYTLCKPLPIMGDQSHNFLVGCLSYGTADLSDLELY